MSQTPINRLPYANIIDLEVDNLTANSINGSTSTIIPSTLTVNTLRVTSSAIIEALTVSSAETVGGPFTANNTVTLGSNSSDAINALGTFQGLTSSGVTTSSLTVTSTATIEAGTVSSNWQVGRIIASSGTAVLSSATIGSVTISSGTAVLSSATIGSATISSGTAVLSSATIGSLTISSGTLNVSSATIGSLVVSSFLTALRLTVSSAASVTSSLTAGSLLVSSAASVTSSLTAGSLLVSSAANITSSLTVGTSATIAAGTVSSAWTVSGPLTASASATLNGDVVLGSNSSDTAVMNAGSFTRPNMPAFFAYNTVTDTNVTGNSTMVTVDFDTEVYDRGSNFATDTFTAPYTAIYHFDTCVTFQGISSNHTGRNTILNTTGLDIVLSVLEISSASFSGTITGLGGADHFMNAGETVSVGFTVTGTSSGIDIFGSTTAYFTWFSGHMVG